MCYAAAADDDLEKNQYKVSCRTSILDCAFSEFVRNKLIVINELFKVIYVSKSEMYKEIEIDTCLHHVSVMSKMPWSKIMNVVYDFDTIIETRIQMARHDIVLF